MASICEALNSRCRYKWRYSCEMYLWRSVREVAASSAARAGTSAVEDKDDDEDEEADGDSSVRSSRGSSESRACSAWSSRMDVTMLQRFQQYHVSGTRSSASTEKTSRKDGR